MNKLTNPNLVNLSNTLLRHYGARSYHPAIPEVLEALGSHRKIAVFLFDGLGESILLAHPKAASFILANRFLSIESTHPATTVAATTAFLTGKSPIETGYLGWSVYLKDRGLPLEVFPNTDARTGQKVGEANLMESLSPQKRLDALLSEAGVKARFLMPYPVDPKGATSFEDEFREADQFYLNGGEFLYAYFTEPDHSLHENGVNALKVDRVIRKLTRGLKKFVKRHPDVLVLSMADHGMRDIELEDLASCPEILQILEGPLSIEPRTRAFFVKPGMEKEFESLFKAHFPDYRLEKADDLINDGYFGDGAINPFARSLLGQYVAIAKGPKSLYNSADSPLPKMKGHHAGESPEEMRILLGLFNR